MPIQRILTQIGKLLRRGAKGLGASGSSAESSAIFQRTQDPVRRRHARVQLFPLHAVSFEPESTGTKLELGNLSISGMGLLTSSLSTELKANDLLEGILHCGAQHAKASARVVHVGKTMIGCQFVGHDSDVNKLVQSYFSLELNALTMISVKPELLQEDPDGIPHWIHGKNNCELFFVSNGDRVVRFNLTFFGNYIEGGEEMKAKYGQIMEEDDGMGKPRHKSSALIRWDATLSAQLEPYALRFLASIPYLEEAHRRAISKMIERTK